MKKLIRMMVFVCCLFFVVSCTSTKYIVTFLDYNGEVIKEIEVKKGENANLGFVPERVGYIFTGWDQSIENVTKDMSVTAQYDIAKYQVVFKGYDGTVLKTETVEYLQDATPPEAPVIEGLTFFGWDKDFKNVKTDLVITALYNAETYTVSFYDHDETLLYVDIVRHGEAANAPKEPIRPGHIFTGWDQEYDQVTSDLSIYAQYEILEYTVTFKDKDGRILQEERLTYGTIPNAPDAPVVDGYIFTGWSPEISAITEDTIYQATYLNNSERNAYVSYLVDFNFIDFGDISKIYQPPTSLNDPIYTIRNIFIGGFRGADQTHYYDQTNIVNRNAYGYEVAVGSNGYVVATGTLVDLPENGFILSGHSTTATYLERNVQVGDYITFDSLLKIVNGYRNEQVSKMININVKLNNILDQIITSNNNYIPLDYVNLVKIFNEAVSLFNECLDNYDSAKVQLIEQKYTILYFLLVEVNGIETKGFWHYPLRCAGYSESNLFEVQRFLDKVVELGFNKIYLNTNFGGYSIYKSKYLEQKRATNNTYTGYYDYLECFIEEAHKRGIKVSAWTNTLICGDGSISSKYTSKGWVLKGFDNAISFNGMYFLDISNPEVEQFLLDVFAELAGNYNLDGIEFDFIRFPNNNIYNKTGNISAGSVQDSGYNEGFMNGFMEKYGLSGDLKALILSSQTVRNNWLDYKRTYLSGMVEKLVTTIKEQNANISISIACMPSISTARNVYLQDWDYWLDMGWVDTLDPMIYSGSVEYVRNALEGFINTVNGRAHMVIGIFPSGDNGGVDILTAQINDIVSRNCGFSKFSGLVIFNNNNYLDAFPYMNREYTVTEQVESHKLIYAYSYDTLDKIINYYQYRDNFNFQTIIDLLEELILVQEVNEGTLLKVDQLIIEINKITNTQIKTKLANATTYLSSLLN